MGQGAARLSTSNAERDEEGANQSPHLLSEEDEVSASHASISSNHPPAQELQEVAVDIPEPPAPPPLEPVEVEPPRAPDVYFGAAFLPEGFVPAPQDALLLGARPELAALVSNGILGRLPQIPAVQSAPSAQSLVHIHRDSILLEPVPDQQDKYILSFRIDALEDCIVHAYWRATENNNGTQATFISQQQSPEWPAMRFPEGRDQLVRYEQHLDLSNVPDEVLQWESAQAGPPPISFVISTATPGPATVVDTEILTARLLKGASGGFTVRPIRVRVRYRGKFYVVYEIFGAADNVPATPTPATTGGTVETLPLLTPTGGRECVICITDPRDTIVLPCRHMCLCVPCAEALRTQTNKCPLCRTPVKGLLKVGALPAPYISSPSPSSPSPHPPTKSSSKNSDGEVEELQLLHRERHSTSADV